ncbi:uncharacterized protein TNCV_22841 [Trichonephila clavipes]|nr:uncharacterized protein TNCV_22841 [Trichonephila clavipes]
MDGRKACGGKLEVKFRIRDPLLVKQVEEVREKIENFTKTYVIDLLTGHQTGFTKYCCLLCECGRRARDKYYFVWNWPRRGTFTPGQKIVVPDPRVPKDNIYLLHLHIKQLLKAIDETGDVDLIS